MTNPSNGGFLLSWKKPSLIDATHAVAGYEADYAFTKYPTQIFKTSTGSTIIEMSFAAGSAPKGIALINHNLTENASIVLRTYSDAFVTFIMNRTIPFNSKNTCLVFDDNDSIYLKLVISDTSLDSIEIGAIYTGKTFQFPFNFKWGHTIEGTVMKQVDTSTEGFHFETPDEESTSPIYKYRKFALSFNDIEHKYFDSFFSLLMPGPKVFIPSFAKSDCALGIVPDRVLSNKKNRTGDEYGLSFLEYAQGVTIE
jgi:hypothetical protein